MKNDNDKLISVQIPANSPVHIADVLEPDTEKELLGDLTLGQYIQVRGMFYNIRAKVTALNGCNCARAQSFNTSSLNFAFELQRIAGHWHVTTLDARR